MTNQFDDDARTIRFLEDYRGVLTGECFFVSGTIVDTEGAPIKIDHSSLVEAERAEYVEGDELGDSWFFDPNQVVEVVIDEAEETEEIEIKASDSESFLEVMKIKDLKALAKELGLKGYSRLKAPELRDVIREAQAPLEFQVVEAGEGPKEAEGV